MSVLDMSAVVIVAILNIVLGMIWYSPNFLGKIWARSQGLDNETLRPGPLQYVSAIFVALLMAAIFYTLLYWLNAFTAYEGLKLGFYIWLGFLFTSHVSGVIWAKKPLVAFLIDTAFDLVNLLMMGAILASWQGWFG